jgi:alkylation response protein AidB-like acyl-CoA dehydrogenase
MSLKLTDEQRMIQTMVREFSRKVIATTASERDKTKEFPSDNLSKMADLGLLGMMIPSKYEGAEADSIGYMLALSEIAYSCASTAVIMSVHNSIVCESILNYGSEDQKETYLKDLALGKYIGAFALTEPQAGSDPVAQETVAIKDGKYYIINGAKRFITSGKNGGLILVTAKTNINLKHKGISVFIVKRDNPGLIVGNSEDKMGLKASDTTDLIFEDCKVPIKDMLGREGEGFQIAMSGLDSGRIGIAAQSIGVAQAALDASIQYINKRKQFGQIISNFQGLRWIIADMATQIEAARQLTFSAAVLKNENKNYTMQASMAKLFASEMVNKITGKAIQLHGGYGFISDYSVERFYRDARVFTIYEGTSEIQRIIISNKLLKNKSY